PTPQSQDRTKKVVLTIVHEKAGRAQLQIHRVIGHRPSGNRVIEKQKPTVSSFAIGNERIAGAALAFR
ncbi:MAG: hypothetical protein WCC78_18200, partial [Terriglobales bacterium]